MRAILWAAIIVLATGLTFGGCAGGDEGATETDAGGDGGDADSDSDVDDPCPNPEVEQPDTGLFWLQCLAGQCFLESDGGPAECVGEPLELEFAEALEACPAGTRLPTLEELRGLLGGCTDIGEDDTQCACDTCFDSDFCDEVYPGMEDVPDISRLHSHWSSTEFDATNAWFAHFKTGIIKKDSMSKKTTVICLREE